MEAIYSLKQVLVVVTVQTYINGSSINKTRINPEHKVHSRFYFPDCISVSKTRAAQVLVGGQVKKTRFTKFFDYIYDIPTVF